MLQVFIHDRKIETWPDPITERDPTKGGGGVGPYIGRQPEAGPRQFPGALRGGKTLKITQTKGSRRRQLYEGKKSMSRGRQPSRVRKESPEKKRGSTTFVLIHRLEDGGRELPGGPEEKQEIINLTDRGGNLI